MRNSVPLRSLKSLTLALIAVACARQDNQNNEHTYRPIDAMRSQTVTDSHRGFNTLSDFEIRWTNEADAPAAKIEAIVAAISRRTGRQLGTSDFFLSEDKPLANTHYARYVQMKDGVPVSGKSIRIWSDLRTGARVQIECTLDLTPPVAGPDGLREGAVRLVSTQSLIENARDRVLNSIEDANVVSVKTEKTWVDGVLVQKVLVKSKHGTHQFLYGAKSGKLISQTYKSVLEGDTPTYAMPAKVFPIWEYPEDEPSRVTERENVNLDELLVSRHTGDASSYSELSPFRFLYSMFDADRAQLPSGEAQGYWSNDTLRRDVNRIFNALPLVGNTPATTRKARLVGKYVGIYLNADAAVKISPIRFSVDPSPQFVMDFVKIPGTTDYEGKPSTLSFGMPVGSPHDVLMRDPLNGGKEPSNDPALLINSGFDEVQVYYAVNYLFKSLQKLGFTDPELSTRPMTAILFDPTIESRDNAYYTDDTINFTTYSPGAQNYARDNTTIWHELGHGIMDRLMGTHLNLADTGGLSEGMADFVAQLVINDKTNGGDFYGKKDMRIYNKTAFHMTNESHDDGEAYGGAMNDFLELAIAKYGFQDGLARVSDVVLEAMRLTRDHPALTAEAWFEHMVFADSLSRNISLKSGRRLPGELRELIIKALETRNYSLSADANYSEMILKNGETEVTDANDGSRGRPVALRLAANESQNFNISVGVKEGDFYKFKFPVTVRASYQGGPLQGAVHWAAENNGPTEDFVINSAAELAKFNVTATGTCDEVNRSDGGCKDFVYMQIWNAGETTHPVAKKRFYVAVLPKN